LIFASILILTFIFSILRCIQLLPCIPAQLRPFFSSLPLLLIVSWWNYWSKSVWVSCIKVEIAKKKWIPDYLSKMCTFREMDTFADRPWKNENINFHENVLQLTVTTNRMGWLCFYWCWQSKKTTISSTFQKFDAGWRMWRWGRMKRFDASDR
jgi:hypothetical protein